MSPECHISLGGSHRAVLCPQVGCPGTPLGHGDTSVCPCVQFGVLWWPFGDPKCVPSAALQGTQWPLFAFGAGEQPLAWEEQKEPAPANTKRAFLSLHDKLVCQQQEVMLPPSSARETPRGFHGDVSGWRAADPYKLKAPRAPGFWGLGTTGWAQLRERDNQLVLEAGNGSLNPQSFNIF